jgi:hypothetical protein
MAAFVSPGGKVRIDLSPELSQTLTQTGSWTIFSGTGAFEGLSGSGEMAVTNDPDPDAPLARRSRDGHALAVVEPTCGIPARIPCPPTLQTAQAVPWVARSVRVSDWVDCASHDAVP